MTDSGSLRGGARLLAQAGAEFRTRKEHAERAEELATLNIERVRWQEFLNRFTWKQGEHVTLIGTTGSGKTTFSLEIVKRRKYVAAFGTKKEDDTLSKLLRSGYMRIPSWDKKKNDWTKVIVWPDISKVKKARDIFPMQRDVFEDAIASILREGGWCLFADELSYLVDALKLDSDMKVMYQQGRSSHISILGSTQRPRFIPLAAYDQATHLVIWRENDEQNVRRIAEMAGPDKDLVFAVIPRLESTPDKGGEFLYLNTRTGAKMISKVEL